MMETAFDKHTYKHTTMGFERDIKDMPNGYDYSKSFFERYYRPENCVLLITGDFDAAKTKDMIKKYYGGWKPGYVAPTIETEPEQTAERTVDVDYPGRTLPIVWMGYKGDAFDPRDKMVAAAYLLADLAFGENSDLYKKLVIREQKVQWVAGDFSFSRDPKMYDVYTRVKDEADIPYVLEEMEKTSRSAHATDTLWASTPPAKRPASWRAPSRSAAASSRSTNSTRRWPASPPRTSAKRHVVTSRKNTAPYSS
jgi:zinc protease